jgi:hypothetical protein
MMDETTNGHVAHTPAKDMPQLYSNVDEKELQKIADACLANVSLTTSFLGLLWHDDWGELLSSATRAREAGRCEMKPHGAGLARRCLSW